MIFALGISPLAIFAYALLNEQKSSGKRLRQGFLEHPVKLALSAIAMLALCSITVWIAVFSS